MATKIPCHKLSDIEKAASVNLVSKSPIKDLPDELVSAFFRIKQEKDDDDSDKKDETNQRFYVDETNMVERRFMKTATTSFDPERDTDIFAEASLHDDIVQCMLSHPSVSPIIKEIQTSMFLEESSSSFIRILEKLISHTEYEKGRLRCKRERGYDEKEVISNIMKDTLPKDIQVGSLAFIVGEPVVIERENGIVQSFGPSPSSKEQTIYWIRCVVDGYLGIMMKAIDAEKRLSDTETLKILKDDYSGVLLKSKKVKVSHLKECYETKFNKKPSKMKKQDLIDCLSEHCIWGWNYPSIITI